MSSPVSVGKPNSGQTPSDSTYGTDKCTKSYSRDKPIVQYVLMIDAGSTGSRIHVYKFNNCGPTPELEKEDFKMTEKSVGGLSKYENDPDAAAKTLDPLLAVAMESVPDKLKGCTPVAVKATAGLRRIGEQKAQAILAQVRTHLENDYPFPVVSDENKGIEIMDGMYEALFAWITVNYLDDKLSSREKGPTAAVFDLGGGSTQIVFEPTFKNAAGAALEKLESGTDEDNYKYVMDYGNHKYELYQHSHLGYGLMAARESVHQLLLADLAKKNGNDQSWMSQPITHPCIITGLSKKVKVKPTADSPEQEFEFVGPTEPSSAQCRNLVERILKMDATCKLAPCSFNGAYQPLLSKTFTKEDLYIISFFYDRNKPLGMPDTFTLREMHDLTQTVCKGKNSWDVFNSIEGAVEDLNDGPDHCLDFNFMTALLHTGYSIPLDRELKIAKKMKGFELGWCLGAR